MAIVKCLPDVLIEILKDLFNAETQFLRALPRCVKQASDPYLKELLRTHFIDTEHRLERLFQISLLIDRPINETTCEGIEGVLKEIDNVASLHSESEELKDLLLIFILQKIMHYQVASYENLLSLAETLENTKFIKSVRISLYEEIAVENALKNISETRILGTLDKRGTVEDISKDCIIANGHYKGIRLY